MVNSRRGIQQKKKKKCPRFIDYERLISLSKIFSLYTDITFFRVKHHFQHYLIYHTPSPKKILYYKEWIKLGF